MEDLWMIESSFYLYLDNPEILLKDNEVFARPRILNKKIKIISSLVNKWTYQQLDFHEIIDKSIEFITAELRPSRFGYVCSVIASEFPRTFLKWARINVLKKEVLDVVNACDPVFGLLKFSTQAPEQLKIYQTLRSFIRHYMKRKRKASLAQYKKTIITPAPELIREKIATIEILPVSKQIPTLNPVRSLFRNSITNPALKLPVMANKQYPINKGINKSLVFKGLKAQYIGYMGLGLLIDLLFYAVLYILKVNTYVTLLLTIGLGALIAVTVYHLNATYGEHGLEKSFAKRKTPKIIRSFSRRIFR